MKFTTFSCADISTCHMTPEDAKLLNKNAASCVVARYTEGWICWVAVDESSWIDQKQSLVDAGFSGAFINLFRDLHKYGIPYCHFDADGKKVGRAPEFDW